MDAAQAQELIIDDRIGGISCDVPIAGHDNRDRH